MWEPKDEDERGEGRVSAEDEIIMQCEVEGQRDNGDVHSKTYKTAIRHASFTPGALPWRPSACREEKKESHAGHG
jgi:hypothetical protein